MLFPPPISPFFIAQMALEIERRFLVTGEDWRAHVAWVADIRQGYLLSAQDGLTVRVRLQRSQHREPQAWFTIKALPGAGASATTRLEFEYPIPIADAEAMLNLAPSRLEKRRHGLQLPGGEWVLDVFCGENAPLLVAEVELEHPDAAPPIPAWCTREITGIHAFSNAALAATPLRTWPPQELCSFLPV